MSKIGKVGLGIVAFEGTEHIKNITYELRSQVDEIVVCLQEVSYTGVRIDQFDIDEVNRCVAAGLVDKVIWYSYSDKDISKAKKSETMVGDWPRILECNKRNKILDTLEKDGCTHATIIDSDEFYTAGDYALAKAYMDTNDVKAAYCSYVNYWQDYRHYLIWDRTCYVPLMAEIKYRFEFARGLGGYSVDKTRVYGMDAGEGYSVMKWDAVHMHHFSWLRLNIGKKIASWSSQKYYDKQVLDYIEKKYYDWKPWENAYVTFRVPLKPICVGVYDEQYVYPHFNLYDKI